MQTGKHFSLFFFIFTGLIITVGLLGCKKPDNSGTASFDITYNLQKTRFTVRFTDAKTGNLIGANDNKSVSVTISGSDKEAVYDISGIKKEVYRSKKGFMTLSLAPEEGHIPSSGQPVRFTLLASCEGYLPTAKSVVITQERNYQIRIALSKADELPAGSTKVYKTGVGQIIDSILASPLTVVTPGIEVKLIIPAGTRILDSERSPLKSPLSISIVHFSTISDQCMAAFPGSPGASVYRNGTITDGTFFPAGYTWIQIVGAEGKIASTFEQKKVTLEMLVDKNTLNTETGMPIAAGDRIGVYHFVSDSGYWQQEVMDSIEVYNEIPPVGDFVVKTEISNLFYYTLGWLWTNNCYQGSALTFSSTSDSGTCCKGYLQGIIKRKQDSAYIGWFGGIASPDDTLYLPFVPASVSGFISWKNDSTSTIAVAEPNNPWNTDNLCNGNHLPIPLVVTSNISVPVTVTVVAHCPSNPNVNIFPSFGIWYRQESSFSWNWAEQSEGKSEICGLVEGENYVIGTYFDNQWNEWMVTIDETHSINLSFDLTSNICSNVFGM